MVLWLNCIKYRSNGREFIIWINENLFIQTWNYGKWNWPLYRFIIKTSIIIIDVLILLIGWYRNPNGTFLIMQIFWKILSQEPYFLVLGGDGGCDVGWSRMMMRKRCWWGQDRCGCAHPFVPPSPTSIINLQFFFFFRLSNARNGSSTTTTTSWTKHDLADWLLIDYLTTWHRQSFSWPFICRMSVDCKCWSIRGILFWIIWHYRHYRFSGHKWWIWSFSWPANVHSQHRRLRCVYRMRAAPATSAISRRPKLAHSALPSPFRWSTRCYSSANRPPPQASTSHHHWHSRSRSVGVLFVGHSS